MSISCKVGNEVRERKFMVKGWISHFKHGESVFRLYEGMSGIFALHMLTWDEDRRASHLKRRSESIKLSQLLNPTKAVLWFGQIDHQERQCHYL